MGTLGRYIIAGVRQMTKTVALFAAIARDLLPQLLPVTLGVRLLGLTQSGLTELESLELSSLTKQMVNTQRTFDF